MLRFRQVGTSLIVIFALAEGGLIITGLVLWQVAGKGVFLVIPIALMTALLLLVGSLTIEVRADSVRCFFGPGLISRTVPMSDIMGVRRVRAHRLNAWGIRRIAGGWLWNTNGFDAVELELADGSRFQMGTGRPDEVVEAIDAVRRVGDDVPA